MNASTGIVTPEAVVLEFETAGVGSRLLAGAIDLLVQLAMFIAVLLAFGAVSAGGVDLGGVGAAALYVSVFLIVFGYPAAMETFWRGRTLGKAALGLRVVTSEGAPIRFRHAAIRSIMALVDWFATQGIVGIVALLLTKRNQRLGDLVAGTIVLRERTAARAPTPVQFAPPPGLESYTATLGTSTLGHEQYASVRAFLLRAPTLPPAVRADLASQLAFPLLDHLRTTPPPGVPPELFLVCVAAAYQRRMAGPARQGSSAFQSVWSGASPVRWSSEHAGPAPVAGRDPAPPVDGGGYAAPG